MKYTRCILGGFTIEVLWKRFGFSATPHYIAYLGTLHSIIAKQSMHAITNPTHLIKIFIHRLPVFHSGHSLDNFNLYVLYRRCLQIISIALKNPYRPLSNPIYVLQSPSYPPPPPPPRIEYAEPSNMPSRGIKST